MRNQNMITIRQMNMIEVESEFNKRIVYKIN